EALAAGFSVERIHELTHIDKWFLHKIDGLRQTAERVSQYRGGACPRQVLRQAKQAGFSDAQIAHFLGTEEASVQQLRKTYGLAPVVKQIDTLAAEYPSSTNFLYLTYNGDTSDVETGAKSVMILGSGVYRIGSSVEFDWCCVTAARTLRQLGYQPIMINY